MTVALQKRWLVAVLTDAISDYTQVQVARWLEVGQPQISRLRKGDLTGVSLERLLTWLERLGYGVEIRLTVPAAPQSTASRRRPTRRPR